MFLNCSCLYSSKSTYVLKCTVHILWFKRQCKVCMYVCMYAHHVQYVCTCSCHHNHARAIKHIFQGAIHTVPVMLACETMRSSSTTSLLLHCSPVLVVFLSMKLDGGVGGLSVSRKAARMTGIIHRMSSTSIRSDMPEMV